MRGFYRGFIPQLLTYGPANGLGATLVPRLLNFMSPEDKPDMGTRLAANAAGWGFAGWVTTPFDVVKTRMQVAAGNKERFPYTGIVDCVKHTHKEGGLPAFFKGSFERVAWFTPRQTFVFSFFSVAAQQYTDKLAKKAPEAAPAPKFAP